MKPSQEPATSRRSCSPVEWKLEISTEALNLNYAIVFLFFCFSCNYYFNLFYRYYKIKGFIEVVAENEYPGRIPSYCAMPVWWTKSSPKNWHEARDVEPSKKFPITTIAEENLLCSKMSGEMDW